MDKINKKVNEQLNFERDKLGMSENSPEMDALYHKMVNRPAYYFTLEYATLSSGATQIKQNEMMQHRADWGKLFVNEADKDVNEKLRLIELDKNILPLIESTKNKIFYRNLFFPSVFVNCDFNFKHLIVKGFLIIDHNQFGFVDELFGKTKSKELSIFFVAIDKKNKSEFYNHLKLCGGHNYGKEFHEFESERKIAHQLCDYVRQLAVNIIDMVEGGDEDLNITTVEITRKQNLKRIKRGKIQLPTKIFIKPTGTFQKYILDFNEEIERGDIKHRFLVRGFWRHYRDEKYKEKQGTKQWIKPFWKGKGITVAKDYKIKG